MEVECLALKDLTNPRKSFTVGAEEAEEDGGHTEQKENICVERRRSTPLKSAESTAPSLLMNRKGANTDLAHITPIKHTVLAEPWTPTANLKMLISAASPDIRDREMKKVLFRPIENEKDKPASPDTVMGDTEVDDSSHFEAVDEEDEAEKKPSRKQKSLGLLCKKFLALYPEYPEPHSPIWISLDEVATSLGVERRRIYDIVNVLESLTIVGRIAKNSYTWYGRQQLDATLEDLQRRGRQQGYHLQMELTAKARGAGPGREDDVGEGDAGNAGGNRKDKSLRIMSQKFVMLFLVSKSLTVTLDAAAKILIEESQDSSSHSKYKTKVRRLYDIANVLTSLGLIKKVHVREERGRKPAFKWLGPVEFNNSGNARNTLNVAAVAPPNAEQPMTGQNLRKAKMARHASFNITPTSVAVQRQVYSAPSSPRPERTGFPNQPVDYSRKTTSNNAVCRLQFGNSSDNQPSAAQQTHTHSRSNGQLPPSSTHTTPLAPSLHPEYLLTSASSPHCLAYLPSLSQPSVVMLYGSLGQSDQLPEGQRSPRLESEEGRKRKREEREEEVVKKKGMPGLEESDRARVGPPREAEESSQTDATRISISHPTDLPRVIEQRLGGNKSSEPTQPSHYLYVPNNAGLNSLNFFLSAGQPPASLALPSSGVPTLALPYVLVPSSALSQYPLVTNGLQQQGSDAHTKLSFSLPTVMSPAHFTAYSLTTAAAPDVSWSPVPSPSTPEQSRQYESTAATPHSPQVPRQTVRTSTPEQLTPQTPKDTTASASKSFFQTPGTLGSAVSGVPTSGRKRGTAQRRLDVGHPPPTS
ncbi:transcription factor E2F7 [Solea solea]|uniref:transcription factor E2F7 n=1 Tax=Solea solea TaxID=90069 RepID=UPI00272B379A|nr:transcription factor E2F7 [Solea solea]